MDLDGSFVSFMRHGCYNTTMWTWSQPHAYICNICPLHRKTLVNSLRSRYSYAHAPELALTAKRSPTFLGVVCVVLPRRQGHKMSRTWLANV